MFTQLPFQYLPSLVPLNLDVDKDSCVLCLSLIHDWGRAGYGAVKEGLLEPKCFWSSCVLERGHVGETLLVLASEVAPCGCDAWALLCDHIHHVMKR